MGEVDEVELSSDADDSAPGDPGLFFEVHSFLIFLSKTCVQNVVKQK